MLRDSQGVPIEKGNRIVFPLSLGQAATGVIIDTTSGLGLDGSVARNPMIVVALTLFLTADPSGTVPGVCRLPEIVEPKVSEE